MLETIKDIQNGEDPKQLYTPDVIEEFETTLNEKYEACATNIKHCFMNNHIEEFNIDFINNLINEVQSIVVNKLFTNEQLELRLRLSKLKNISTEVYNGFKDIVIEIANEVENVFSLTFETI